MKKSTRLIIFLLSFSMLFAMTSVFAQQEEFKSQTTEIEENEVPLGLWSNFIKSFVDFWSAEDVIDALTDSEISAETSDDGILGSDIITDPKQDSNNEGTDRGTNNADDPGSKSIEADYKTVNEMLEQENLTVGSIISTAGFYDEGDGGSAEYEVVNAGIPDNITTFELSNGLNSRLIVTDSVNVLQFGAKPEIGFDNRAAIQSAFNSNASVIIFPHRKEFYIGGDISLSGDKSYLGQGSTIVTDNNFDAENISGFGYVLKIFNVNNVTIDGLNVTSTNDTQNSITSQLGIANSEQVTVTNCIFTGPEATYTSDNLPQVTDFSNVEVTGGWADITIKNNEMYLLHDGDGGHSLLVDSNIDSGGSGISIVDNYMEHSTAEEVLVVCTGNSSLSAVNIVSNTFVTKDGTHSSSPIGISLGASNESILSEVVFSGNRVELESTTAGLSIKNTGGDVAVSENHFTLYRGMGNERNSSGDTEGGYGILGYGDGLTTFSDNQVFILNNGKKYVSTILSGNLEVTNNNITIDGNVAGAIFDVRTATNNTVNSEGSVNMLTYNVENFIDNDVTVGSIVSYFRYYDTELDSSYFIENNNITTNTDITSYLLMFHSTTALDGSGFSVTGNQFSTPGASKRDFLYLFDGQVEPTADKKSDVGKAPDSDDATLTDTILSAGVENEPVESLTDLPQDQVNTLGEGDLQSMTGQAELPFVILFTSNSVNNQSLLSEFSYTHGLDTQYVQLRESIEDDIVPLASELVAPILGEIPTSTTDLYTIIAVMTGIMLLFLSIIIYQNKRLRLYKAFIKKK